MMTRTICVYPMISVRRPQVRTTINSACTVLISGSARKTHGPPTPVKKPKIKKRNGSNDTNRYTKAAMPTTMTKSVNEQYVVPFHFVVDLPMKCLRSQQLQLAPKQTKTNSNGTRKSKYSAWAGSKFGAEYTPEPSTSDSQDMLVKMEVMTLTIYLPTFSNMVAPISSALPRMIPVGLSQLIFAERCPMEQFVSSRSTYDKSAAKEATTAKATSQPN
mmetsp:Transcript_37754/g.87250  ORF Transcript_37754/g.87250 Transcript_37754/m.87250 type:complete len:217 (+) Transcript_37754:505-1155(+)